MEKIYGLLSRMNIEFLNMKIFAIITFFVFVIFRKLFSSIILKIIFWMTKNKGKVKECRIYKPLNYFFVFFGLYCATKMLDLSLETMVRVDLYFRIICIILITNMINSFITKDAKWVKKYLEHHKNNEAVGNFICKIIKSIVWIIAGYIILNELGYDLTGLVAGFGLGGVMLSLAAQDTVKSLLSGVVILTDKPFDLGDFIEVGNYKGTVVDMTFRSTRIKASDNSIITIPNATITSESIVNWNKIQSRRLDFVLNLSMNTVSEKIKNVVEKIKLILRNNPDVLPETVQVSLDEIASYSIDIKIFLYINETDYRKFLTSKEKIYCDILELVERENIDLAYPTQTIYVKDTESEARKKVESV